MYICLTCKKGLEIKDINATAICKYCSGRVFIKERAKIKRTHTAK